MSAKKKVYITGHLNPDTDSICSAIAYAELKNRLGGADYIACRAGALSRETEWVLKHFGLKVPHMLHDVIPRIADAELQKIEGIDQGATVKEAWRLMHSQDVATLPVLTQANRIAGIIDLKDLAVAYMESLDAHALAHSSTRYSKIAETLQGELILEGGGCVDRKSHIIIGAGDDEAIALSTKSGDVVLISNRQSSQLAAIRRGAGAIIVCLSAKVEDTVLKEAEKYGCAVISTPLDTYRAAYFINQSVPASHYMKTSSLTLFHMGQTIEDALSDTGSTKHVYFPVLDSEGTYQGMVTRRNLLSYRKKQLILVDHNESTQCVPGWENSEILEIIDHHRVGGLRTINPIYFRNQPLGSTASIVYMMYLENGLLPDRAVAGALCCAIISDTLKFRSPTVTPADVSAAEKLADIAGTTVDELADEMFRAGENLEGKTGSDLLHQDYKEFEAFGTSLAVAQLSFFSGEALSLAASLVRPALEEECHEKGIRLGFVLLTDIGTQRSKVLLSGSAAKILLKTAFPGADHGEDFILDGVISRKKQFVPPILQALAELTEEKQK